MLACCNVDRCGQSTRFACKGLVTNTTHHVDGCNRVTTTTQPRQSTPQHSRPLAGKAGKAASVVHESMMHTHSLMITPTQPQAKPERPPPWSTMTATHSLKITSPHEQAAKWARLQTTKPFLPTETLDTWVPDGMCTLCTHWGGWRVHIGDGGWGCGLSLAFVSVLVGGAYVVSCGRKSHSQKR
jgi:hypothetical protein